LSNCRIDERCEIGTVERIKFRDRPVDESELT
jgi:hypothetical protein